MRTTDWLWRAPQAVGSAGSVLRCKLRLLHGARHAVLRTLYSRAHRVGDESASCFLRNLEKRTSIVLGLAAVVVQIVKPSLELIVFLEHELQGLANDVGFRRIDELRILCESRSDMLLDSDLKRLISWWFRRRLQNCHAFSPFLHARLNKACMKLCLLRLFSVEKRPTAIASRAGATPRLFGRLKPEKAGSLPPVSVFFPR